jgi:hypothetical protein
MAIGNDRQLAEYDQVHDFDNNYLLTNTEAQQHFNSVALKNLEEVVNSCA